MTTEVESRLGYTFTAATISNTSLTTTDPQIVKLGANYVAVRLQGMHLYLATAAEERTITTMSVSGSTATINFVGGGNATNQAGATTVHLLRVPWSELKALANDALEFIPCQCLYPLAHGPDDFHMQDNNTTSWTGSNTTLTKQTTASEVNIGARSLSITLTSAAGYAESTVLRTAFDKQVIAHVIGKHDTGTGSVVRILDNAGTTLDTVSFTQEDWQYIKKTVTAGSTARGVKFRLAGTDNNDQLDVGPAWFVRPATNVFRLPAAIDARFKVRDIIALDFYEGTNEGDVYLADAFIPTRLIKDEDYEMNFRPGDANPSMVVIKNRAYMTLPLFVVAEIPYSAPYGVSAVFTTDASTTNCDPHVLIAYWKKLIGANYKQNFPQAEDRGDREYAERTRAREQGRTKPAIWTGPLGGIQL